MTRMLYLMPDGRLAGQGGHPIWMTQAEFEACCCDTWHSAGVITVSTERMGYEYYVSHYEYIDEDTGYIEYYPIVPDPLADSHWASLYATVQAATPWSNTYTPVYHHVGHLYDAMGPAWWRPGEPTQSELEGHLFEMKSTVYSTLDFNPATHEAHTIVLRLDYNHTGTAFMVEVVLEGTPIDSWLVDGNGSRDIEVATYGSDYIEFVVRPVADPAYPGSTGTPPIGLDYEGGLDINSAKIKYRVRDK